MADPLDKQLVEAVLTRPRRAKAEVEAPWKGIVSLHEWTLHDTERKTRTTKPQHRLPLGDEAHRLVHDAIHSPAAADLLVAPPDFHLVKAGRDAQSDGTKDLLKEAR